MPAIWRLPPAGTLAGTMRIPLDKADSGDPNDTVHTDLDDLLEFVEEHLDVDSSAIASPDASVSLAATDEGLVVEGAQALDEPTHGLGVTEDGLVGLIPLGLPVFAPEPDPGKLVVTAGTGIAPGIYTINELAAGIAAALSPSIENKAPLYQSVDGPQTTSFAAIASDAGKRRRVASIAIGGVVITLDAVLFGSGQAGCTWWTEYVVDDVSTPLSFLGTNGLVLSYYGPTVYAVGDVIRVTVESATVCRVATQRLGEQATKAALDAHTGNTDNPHATTAAQVGADPKTTVQTAHTAATLTLANADNNQHRALNTASNSIAISIPDTLTFPFVWTARKSSASNSVTITTGAGLITPKASGTVPVTAVDAWITIFAESSTVAAVFVTVAT